ALAVAERLARAAGVVAIARLHDGERLGRGQDGAMAGPRVIAMAVGDDGAVGATRRVDVEIARNAVEAPGRDPEPVLGACVVGGKPHGRSGRQWAGPRQGPATAKAFHRARRVVLS